MADEHNLELQKAIDAIDDALMAIYFMKDIAILADAETRNDDAAMNLMHRTELATILRTMAKMAEEPLRHAKEVIIEAST